jgi:hypothetical protein
LIQTELSCGDGTRRSSIGEYSLDAWNNGTAVQDIEKFKTDCLGTPMNDQFARVSFPTSGFNSFVLRYDGTQASLRDVDKLSVTDDLVSGKEIVAFKGCFVYRTLNEVHRTSFCFSYQAKTTDV